MDIEPFVGWNLHSKRAKCCKVTDVWTVLQNLWICSKSLQLHHSRFGLCKIWILWDLDCKVHVYWGGHKINKNFTVNLTVCSNRQINCEDFVNFCGLLRKHELYKIRILQYLDGAWFGSCKVWILEDLDPARCRLLDCSRFRSFVWLKEQDFENM